MSYPSNSRSGDKPPSFNNGRLDHIANNSTPNPLITPPPVSHNGPPLNANAVPAATRDKIVHEIFPDLIKKARISQNPNAVIDDAVIANYAQQNGDEFIGHLIRAIGQLNVAFPEWQDPNWVSRPLQMLSPPPSRGNSQPPAQSAARSAAKRQLSPSPHEPQARDKRARVEPLALGMDRRASEDTLVGSPSVPFAQAGQRRIVSTPISGRFTPVSPVQGSRSTMSMSQSPVVSATPRFTSPLNQNLPKSSPVRGRSTASTSSSRAPSVSVKREPDENQMSLDMPPPPVPDQKPPVVDEKPPVFNLSVPSIPHHIVCGGGGIHEYSFFASADFVAQAQRWVNREKMPSEELWLRLELRCVTGQALNDMERAWQSLDEAQRVKTTSTDFLCSIPVTWAGRHTIAHVEMNRVDRGPKPGPRFMSRKGFFDEGSPALDITEGIREGINTIRIIQVNDMTGYVLAFSVTRPPQDTPVDA